MVKSIAIGIMLVAFSSAALADVSVGEFTDKRATMSDDKGSKSGNPNYIGTLYGGYGWKTGEAGEDKPVSELVHDHVAAALKAHGVGVSTAASAATIVSGTIAVLDASAFKNREAEVKLQVVVTRDGNQVFSKEFSKKTQEKTGFFTTNGAAWSSSKHREEVRLCAEHALDQTLDDVMADSEFMAAVK